MRGKIYQFEDYLLDVSEQRLQKNGVDIQLPPKVFEVLTVLIERRGQLVTRDELMNEVWQDTFVEETNLRYCIHSLRKIFEPDLIETVPKRGYRFNAAISVYSREDFISKNAVQKPVEGDFDHDETKPGSSFSKPVMLFSLAVLLAITGVTAYFFRTNTVRSEKRQYLTSIAVLPFTIIGDRPEQQGELQRGLSDSLIFNLGKIKDLKVTQAKDIQAYIGKEFDPVTVGKSLNADEVLTGTYRIENNLVRVNVSLLRASDGEPQWTQTFTVMEATQIDTENAISLPIARQISLKLARLRDAERIKTSDIGEESKKNYLTAREIMRLGDFNRRREASELFEKILAAHPVSALANAGYAEALVLTHGGATACQNAPERAHKALAIDGSFVEAYPVLGLCHQYNYDWKSAEQAYQKAIQTNPDYARVYHEYALMLDFQRRFSEAEANFKKAVELDPFSPDLRAAFCQHYYFDRNYAEALAQCFEAKKIEPEFWMVPKKLHWIYVAQGRFEEVFKLHYGNLTEADVAKNRFAKMLSDGDIKKYWEASLETRLNDSRKRSSPFAIATFYTQLGEKEKALDFLEQEFDTEYCKCNLPLANSDPIFDTVRKEKRFIELMRKINLN